MPSSPPAKVPSNRRRWVKALVFSLFVAAAAAGYWRFGEELTLANLAASEAELREAQAAAPALAFAVGFLVYVLATGLSLPGATGLTLVAGWFFGFWQGRPARQLRLDDRSDARLRRQPLPVSRRRPRPLRRTSGAPQ